MQNEIPAGSNQHAALLVLLKKNYSKKEEHKLTNSELKELLKYKSALPPDKWTALSEQAKREVRKQRENLVAEENGERRETKEQIEDVVSEGEIQVGPRRSKSKEKEEYKKLLDILQIACGVDSYTDIYSVLHKTLNGYQQLSDANSTLQKELTANKRKTKKLYEKVIEMHQWRSSIREKIIESNEKIKTLRQGHEDLLRSTRQSLYTFHSELADFSHNFQKLLVISPPHPATPSPSPSPSPPPPSPSKSVNPKIEIPPSKIGNVIISHPARSSPPPQSTPQFIPSFYTPIPPHSPSPPLSFSSSQQNDVNYNNNNMYSNNLNNTNYENSVEYNNYQNTPNSSRYTPDYYVITKKESLDTSTNDIVQGIRDRARKMKNKKTNPPSQMQSGKIFVCARICPIFRNILSPDKSIVVLPTEDTILISRDATLVESKSYALDAFFPAHITNEEMAGKLKFFPLCPILGARNSCLFTLGECSSGKTWTMNGTEESAGLMDRLVTILFEEIEQINHSNSSVEISVKVSAAHMLFDNIDDTIATMSKKFGIVQTYLLFHRSLSLSLSLSHSHSLSLSTSPFLTLDLIVCTVPSQHKGLEHAQELTSIPITTIEEFYDLHSLIFHENCYDHQHMLANSNVLPLSRPSFCVLYKPDMDGDVKCQLTHRIVIVRVITTNKATGESHMSSLTFVDLAGFENISKHVNLDEMRKKTRNANILRVKKDLHSLSDVLISIKSKENPIPYRRSKLAHFLKDELDPKCKIGIIATALASVDHFDEVIDTLSFATKIK